MALSIFYHQTHFSSLPDKNKFSIALKSDKAARDRKFLSSNLFSAVFATFMVWLRSGYGISSSTSQFRKSFAATSANISLLSDMTISLKNLNYILEIKKPQNWLFLHHYHLSWPWLSFVSESLQTFLTMSTSICSCHSQLMDERCGQIDPIKVKSKERKQTLKLWITPDALAKITTKNKLYKNLQKQKV